MTEEKGHRLNTNQVSSTSTTTDSAKLDAQLRPVVFLLAEARTVVHLCMSGADSSGQPRVEKGHRPEENQVSSTSGSCRSTTPAPALLPARAQFEAVSMIMIEMCGSETVLCNERPKFYHVQGHSTPKPALLPARAQSVKWEDCDRD